MNFPVLFLLYRETDASGTTGRFDDEVRFWVRQREVSLRGFSTLDRCALLDIAR